MNIFRDEDAALRAKERLEEFGGRPLDRLLDDAFTLSPNPDLALNNLERWLRAVSSPQPFVEQLIHAPALARQLMIVLGGSQPVADALVQNPELATILFDPQELGRKPTKDGVEKEGSTLLASVSSPTHGLDRLRFLKQRWTLPIVLNDLSGSWSEPVVWSSLSTLADALMSLTIEKTWSESPLSEKLGRECPILFVAFGKLGGKELNYSSDIDLVYVAPNNLSEPDARESQRFCEAVSRALSDSMGRGFLYRVDLRLRPYGAAGPILPSEKAVQNYYNLYAEPWEIQALLRSRPVYGPAHMADAWNEMRLQRCFGSRVSEAFLTPLISMRSRIEERAEDDDLKRGAGGIRDVEFLVQILQLVHGHDVPEVRALATLDAIHALEEAGLMGHAVSKSLQQGYIFLRQLEHRCQLVADQQTHTIPPSPEARDHLAKLMGEATWKALDRHLKLHRRTISTLYQSIVHPAVGEDTHRKRIAKELGPLSHAALQWFDAFPDSDAFYVALEENESSMERVRAILERGPALVDAFRRSVPLTEMLLSGEIEEEFSPTERMAGLPLELPLPQLAGVYADLQARIAAQWIFDSTFDIGLRLSQLADSLLVHACKRLYANFDIVALGSYGREDLGLHSDADVVLLTKEGRDHAEAEQQAQGFLSLFQSLKRHGAPIEVDLRLRPEGRQGLLVRTYDGLKAYELSRMEMWERFALGSSRMVHGKGEAREVLVRAAYAMPLTPERIKELTAMKKRIETERVPFQYARRNVKLGHGGLGDIEWFVHLHEMRYPMATKAGENIRLEDGIRALGRAHLINAVETEQLLAALKHLLNVRVQLALLGYRDDLVPENPDKLDRLAHISREKDGNAFLQKHEHMIDTVRAIYTEGMERLRA